MANIVTEHHLLRLSKLLAFILLPILGGLQAWALASWNGEPNWWMQILALAFFAMILDSSRSLRQAAWRSWWFALCWLVGVFWWLYISMHTYGGLPVVLASAAVLALAAFCAFFYMLAGMLYWRLRVEGFFISALLFSACWILAELVRGQLFTGFPWGNIGYTQIDGPFAWLAGYVGVYGIAAVAAGTAMLLSFSISALPAYIFGRFISVSRLPIALPRVFSAFIWLAVVMTLNMIGAHWQRQQDLDFDQQLAQQSQPVSVALLQGNIPVSIKFEESGVIDSINWYGQQFLENKAQLVIAPETAIPVLKKMLPIDYYQLVTEPFRKEAEPRALLFGLPLGSSETGFRNSVQGITAKTPDYVYNKYHLVPFGEFVPLFFQWFNKLLGIPFDNFMRGAKHQPTFEWNSHRLGLNICYEDLFGEELARQFIDVEKAPTILVNFSNIGWFGDGVALPQHLHISRMRALELQRPMLRATNTGATAVIDHRGKVLALAPYATRTVLEASVQGIQSNYTDSITIFAKWAGKFGLVPVWISAICIVALCFYGRRRVSNLG